jgi:hypothetical protein
MIGLRETFQEIPGDVFDAMGNVVLSAQLTQYSISYVAGGDPGITPTIYPIRVIVDTISKEEIGNGIARSGDMIFLTPAIELPVIPEEEDSVTLNGVVWNIYKIETDPAEALWELATRQ